MYGCKCVEMCVNVRKSVWKKILTKHMKRLFGLQMMFGLYWQCIRVPKLDNGYPHETNVEKRLQKFKRTIFSYVWSDRRKLYNSIIRNKSRQVKVKVKIIIQ